MAHFSQIDSDNIVIQTIVVNNSEILDSDGIEQESIGIEFCKNLLGGNWIQTSYNKRIRKNYALPGYKYDVNKDAFIPPQPDPSFVLDENTCQWINPAAPTFDDTGKTVVIA